MLLMAKTLQMVITNVSILGYSKVSLTYSFLNLDFLVLQFTCFNIFFSAQPINYLKHKKQKTLSLQIHIIMQIEAKKKSNINIRIRG